MIANPFGPMMLHQDPVGPCTYFNWSKNYLRHALRCVSAEAERNGFDLLREAYEGRILQTNLMFQTHEIGVVLLSLFFGFDMIFKFSDFQAL